MSSMKASPRQMMELAVKAMRASVAERRNDGKATPAVGAVLVAADGTVTEAFRGELRGGDHAEYTLLERKLCAARLDGATLYTTLEPCAPGARKEPKLDCAQRILLARIVTVYVGIEDPDPKVDRKGIKYLQDNGVDVRLFDRDLQEEIRAANEEFIAGAEDRKKVASAGVPTPPRLSGLEATVPGSDQAEFSTQALMRYWTALKVTDGPDSDVFRQRLAAQRLVFVEKNGRTTASGFGLLLFGQSPRDRFPQATLLATLRREGVAEETRDFDGPLVLMPEQVIQWLRDKLPTPIDRTDAVRKDAAAPFFELVRESIVNALVHRDYDIGGAKCQLEVSDDTVTVMSPGAPVHPVTMANMQAFNAPTLSRNPLMHFVFAKMGMAEERGLGLKSLKERASEMGLPLPKYEWRDPYLVLTLFRRPNAALRILPAAAVDALNEEQRRGWIFLSGLDAATQTQYAEYMNLNPRTAQRHLAEFVKLGLVARKGAGPGTKYVRL